MDPDKAFEMSQPLLMLPHFPQHALGIVAGHIAQLCQNEAEARWLINEAVSTLDSWQGPKWLNETSARRNEPTADAVTWATPEISPLLTGDALTEHEAWLVNMERHTDYMRAAHIAQDFVPVDEKRAREKFVADVLTDLSEKTRVVSEEERAALLAKKSPPSPELDEFRPKIHIEPSPVETDAEAAA